MHTCIVGSSQCSGCVVYGCHLSVTIIDVPLTAPLPTFEQTAYTVPENDTSGVPLCVDLGVEITQPLTYTITTAQKSPSEAEGMNFTEKHTFQIYSHCFLSLSLSLSTDSDFGTSAEVTIQPPGTSACIDFTDLVVDDEVALEGDEAFTILVGESMAMVTIIDDDGRAKFWFTISIQIVACTE